MKTLSILKINLIEQILVSKNEELLSAIQGILNATEIDDTLSLDSYQIEMLQMSEQDIKDGNIISEEEITKEDAQWMD